MAMLIAQAHPEADEAGVFKRLIEIRPRAWPNSRMIEFADNVLGRGGRLVEALAGLYRAQIPRIPEIANYMREHGAAANMRWPVWETHTFARTAVEQ